MSKMFYLLVFGGATSIPVLAFQIHPLQSVRHGAVGTTFADLEGRALHAPKQRLSTRCYSAVDSGHNNKLMAMFAAYATNEAVPSTWNKAVHRFFLGDVGPPLVVISIAGFVYARLQLSAPLSLTDATIFLATIMIWWVQEYFFHRVLLHSPFDWIGKSIHKGHHEKDYFHVSIDPPALLLGWLFTAHLTLKSFMPWHLCLTATIGYAIAGLFYEWSHYIVHTRVRVPAINNDDSSLVGLVSSAAAKLFSQMRDNHVRHHRIDDSYWFAFSISSMDDAFGTNPDIKSLKRGIMKDDM
ncbi:hypothetical protein ACHAWO_002731 [Cyclotella atomus]|uniref:Fatty acid hydroxylase domain-containing protein n=1 Tax=Cyclotella atomus TaxID=382360 RepID=A0ABD3QLB1_9STRA